MLRSSDEKEALTRRAAHLSAGAYAFDTCVRSLCFDAAEVQEDSVRGQDEEKLSQELVCSDPPHC